MRTPAAVAVIAVLALVVLAGAAVSARAAIRISDLDLSLHDRAVTVHVMALGAVPPAFREGLESGLAAHVRYTVELWQNNRLWRDTLVVTRVVERHLTYNVVSKEYKVVSVAGESRAPFATREIHDAQRMLSEIRGLTLAPATALDPAEVFYVRVIAEAALNGENTLIGRIAGTAEQTSSRSPHRTLPRAP
ncbi:MAG: DUF4390 domain-containing protein [Candidatus Rokuibacteriota bacterium]